MAGCGSPVRDLCHEATCSICLDFFKDPVTIVACGHNFCRSCLTQCWGESEEEASCPQCRAKGQPKNLIPNRQLANFVELTKKLSLQGEERVCEKHQEPLKLFCKKDDTPICVVCDKSTEHKDHEVILAEEAAQEYKKGICGLLEFLSETEERILEKEVKVKKESQDLLVLTKGEREKTVAKFRQLHHFLEEQEKLLLAQMDEVEKEIGRKREDHLAKLSGDLSSLQSLAKEMEEKCQQPPSEFLQDIENTLERFVEQINLDDTWERGFSPAEIWRTWEFCETNLILEDLVKQFKEMLISGCQLQKANVTFDPETAHPQLILSEDHKSMTVGSKCQDLPPNPERFDHYFFVLGHEEFTTGRYFWEVTVRGSNDWAVGVARKSVQRKGRFRCGPGEGFWAVGTCKGIHTDPSFTYVSEDIRTIGVSLDYPRGRVAFYNAETGDQLSVISVASFSGETIHPFFYLGKKSDCLFLFSGFSKPCLSLAP